jgi:hypothetical protein
MIISKRKIKQIKNKIIKRIYKINKYFNKKLMMMNLFKMKLFSNSMFQKFHKKILL